MPPERNDASRAPRTFRSLSLLLLILAALVRLPHITRSLWLDEAWVANAILAESPREWFFYGAWAQSTPPLFVLFTRAVVSLFGPSNLAFRLVPLALAMVAIVFFLAYSRRLFGTYLSLICATAFSLAPAFCFFSQELKQYTADLAVATVILLVLWKYADDPAATWNGYRLTVILFAVAPFLSYTSVMYLPLAVAVVVMMERNLRRTVIFVLVSGLAFSTTYFLFIRPNTVENLQAFFRLNFPTSVSPSALVSYYFHRFSDLMTIIAPEGLEKLTLAVVLTFTFIAVIGAFRPVRNVRRMRIVAFSIAPVFVLVIANATRHYPLGVARLNLFLLPSLVILPTLGVEILLEHIRQVFGPAWNWRAARLATAGLVVLILCSAILVGYKMKHRAFTSWEDAESAVSYVWSLAQPGDLVYVHATLAEQVKLHERLKGKPAAAVAFGDTGWPCCPRDKDFAMTNSDGDYLRRDLQSKLPNGTEGVIWELATSRASHWKHIGRNETQLIEEELLRRGCSVENNRQFHNVLIARFNCGGLRP